MHEMHGMQESWSNKNFRRLIGKPVGVSFANGHGASGVLCSIDNNELYLLEYLYQNQFAVKHYPLNSIQRINPFPPCQSQCQPQKNPPRPPQLPRPPRRRRY